MLLTKKDIQDFRDKDNLTISRLPFLTALVWNQMMSMSGLNRIFMNKSEK